MNIQELRECNRVVSESRVESNVWDTRRWSIIVLLLYVRFKTWSPQWIFIFSMVRVLGKYKLCHVSILLGYKFRSMLWIKSQGITIWSILMISEACLKASIVNPASQSFCFIESSGHCCRSFVIMLTTRASKGACFLRISIKSSIISSIMPCTDNFECL